MKVTRWTRLRWRFESWLEDKAWILCAIAAWIAIGIIVVLVGVLRGP